EPKAMLDTAERLKSVISCVAKLRKAARTLPEELLDGSVRNELDELAELARFYADTHEELVHVSSLLKAGKGKDRSASCRAGRTPRKTGSGCGLPPQTEDLGDGVTLVRSRARTRAMSLRVRPDGRVEVRVPVSTPIERVRAFVDSREQWIARHRRMAEETAASVVRLSPAELDGLGRELLPVLQDLVAGMARDLHLRVTKLTLRPMKSRWGSCSRTGHVSLNTLRALAPDPVRRYVVVHELCHLFEMNHSPRFWQHVARVMPDYMAARRWLTENGQALLARLPF
ncbi:MAG: SprT family zinc-dependent metalloprotease, partial [Desulfovibrionaceae bacterium]|nr:SprT family zinc-dependent metalloprotease [Desulfovibrionaceae bacterium]